MGNLVKVFLQSAPPFRIQPVGVQASDWSFADIAKNFTNYIDVSLPDFKITSQ